MTLEAPATPTARQRARFERDGFLVLEETGCSRDVLDRVIEDLDGLYEGDGRKDQGVFYHERRIQDAWRISDNVRALALSAQVRDLLAGLYGREPLPFQTLNFRFGSEQAVHSDTIHFNSHPAGFMCGVWAALEDIDMENGPLVYYPGSHVLPELTMEDVGAEARYEDYPRYERFVADMIERKGLEPAYGTLRKGQALIWSANLLHGGLPQHDPSRTRHSQVTHYFFEGCRYYTPMTSSEGRVEWRDPAWVSDEAARDRSGTYDAGRIRATVTGLVPEGATVLVVDKGDEDLLRVGGRQMRHLPRNPDGTPAWHDPENSDDLLEQIAREYELGARYLLIPSASLWWLDHYEGFARRLEQESRLLARDSDCALIAL